MKGALVLITVLVFASMTESSSARWVKNRVKAFHHLQSHKTAVAHGTIYTNIQRSIKKYLSAWSVHHDDDGTGCGATCDQEFVVGYNTCISLWPDSDPDPEEFLACWVTFFDSDCHDCLCEAIYDNLGVSCPA